jgi:hypothetical protein
MRHGHVVIGDGNSASGNVGERKETEVKGGGGKRDERDGRKGKGKRGIEERERG